MFKNRKWSEVSHFSLYLWCRLKPGSKTKTRVFSTDGPSTSSKEILRLTILVIFYNDPSLEPGLLFQDIWEVHWRWCIASQWLANWTESLKEPTFVKHIWCVGKRGRIHSVICRIFISLTNLVFFLLLLVCKGPRVPREDYSAHFVLLCRRWKKWKRWDFPSKLVCEAKEKVDSTVDCDHVG